MKSHARTLTIGLVSTILALTPVAPAQAINLPVDKPPVASATEPLNVHARQRDRDRRGFYRGHRGSRNWRRGYRRHNDGWWYPRAAFSAQVIVGPTRNRARGGYGNRHVRWCAERYRTYRPSDNTYVPRRGVRAQCRSPYAGGTYRNRTPVRSAPRYGSSRHVQWCVDRYRTYRPSDNTYVPRIGVRAECRSPYSR